jgi:site-specific recombinase XerD
MDVATAVRSYLSARHASRELAPATFQSVRSVLARFARGLEDFPVCLVGPAEVEAWLAGQSVAASTLARNLSIVRTFFGWCAQRELVVRDPTVGLRGPRCGRPAPRRLSATEVARVLEHAPDARARLIVLLMVQEGLRRGEVARLDASDVDLMARVARITGKGGKVRWVPISEQTAGELRALGPGPVVCSYRDPGCGLGADTVGAIVSRVMRDAGVKRAAYDGRSAHALRHTFASDVLDRHADLRDLQELLGHDSLRTTAVYTRRAAALSRLRDAAGGRVYGSR